MIIHSTDYWSTLTLAWKTHKTCKIRDKIGKRNRKVDSIGTYSLGMLFALQGLEDDLWWLKVFLSRTIHLTSWSQIGSTLD